MSLLTNAPLVYEALGEGARGCISAYWDAEAMRDAVTALLRGETVLPAEVAGLLAGEIRSRVPGNGAGLTAGELKVLALLAQGYSNPAIGSELFISEATVKSHLHQLYAKLHVQGRAGAAAEALRRHLVD